MTKDKTVVIFMGGLDDPYVYQLNNKKAKVYRKTYAKQKNSLAMIAGPFFLELGLITIHQLLITLC